MNAIEEAFRDTIQKFLYENYSAGVETEESCNPYTHLSINDVQHGILKYDYVLRVHFHIPNDYTEVIIKIACKNRPIDYFSEQLKELEEFVKEILNFDIFSIHLTPFNSRI